MPRTQTESKTQTETNVPREVAIKWLRYAESALREEVEPSLLSAGPLSWVTDVQRSLGVKPGGLVCQLRIADRAIKEVIEIVYRNPLAYPRTSQFLVRRSLRR